MENAEINSIIKIVGLQYKKNYSDPESLKSLRYGKIMIMTDQVCFHHLPMGLIYLTSICSIVWKSFLWPMFSLLLVFNTLIWMDFTVFLWQDQDGSHIKGLLINFIHHNWPSLLRHNFLEEFITPIIKVPKFTGSVGLKSWL